MNGIAIIDKPAGPTSHDVVARVRRILRERRVGHTGTLDPFATGVLVVLVGRATRLAQFLAGAEKEYQALVRFGYATDTGDSTGEPRPNNRINNTAWSDEQIEAALASLRGRIKQVPPMYSAKKIQGQKLYDLARRGVEVERAPVPIIIHELEIMPQAEREGDPLRRNSDGTCDLAVRVVCSAGTYVRVLAESIGEKLGVDAHLAALRRTRAGIFRVEDATSLDRLQTMAETGGLTKALLPLEAALSQMPFVHLSERDVERTRHGAVVHLDGAVVEWEDECRVQMRDEQEKLIAIGIYSSTNGQLHPRILLETEED